jgi:hypothetical protein
MYTLSTIKYTKKIIKQNKLLSLFDIFNFLNFHVFVFGYVAAVTAISNFDWSKSRWILVILSLAGNQ